MPTTSSPRSSSMRSTDVAKLAKTWEIVRNEALPRRQSTELIKEVAKSWAC